MNFDLTGITHITQDSREVRAGSLFVALTGEKVDGVQFILQAEAAGAVAVLCAEDAVIPDTHMRVIRAKNIRLALAQLAAQFYPKQPAHMVAVTGTDGKTSTADFFRQLAHLCGYTSASIGTLGVFAGDGTKLYEGTHTTPDPITLHRMLQEMAEAGTTHVCMEASSHGLDQYRLHGVRLDAAAFTNFARDHMDYHKTDEAYFRAKMKLFTEILPAGKIAVLNGDDQQAKNILALCQNKKTRLICKDFLPWEGHEHAYSDFFEILSITPCTNGQKVRIAYLKLMQLKVTLPVFDWEIVIFSLEATKKAEIHVPLVGKFQVYNILTALGLLVATGMMVEELLPLIPQLKGVRGRLEHVANTTNGASVYVDYAHTPAALENILRTLRPHTHNKLHVVFGCGGDRDKGKRPLMGKAAAELADVVIVTDDNPRHEDAAAIRKAVMAGCPDATEIGDRRAAIRAAIAGLSAGDVLVIAGKGHEDTQIIGDDKQHFDDAEVVREGVAL